MTKLAKNDFTQQLQANMATMRRLMAARLQHATGKPGISASQCDLLFLVYEHDLITLKELASIMHVTPGAITQLVEGLEKADLLKRVPSVRDRRSVTVTVTPNGLAKLAVFQRMHKKLFNDLTATLTEVELRTMNSIHQKMINHLKQSPKPEPLAAQSQRKRLGKFLVPRAVRGRLSAPIEQHTVRK